MRREERENDSEEKADGQTSWARRLVFWIPMALVFYVLSVFPLAFLAGLFVGLKWSDGLGMLYVLSYVYYPLGWVAEHAGAADFMQACYEWCVLQGAALGRKLKP